MSVKPWMPFRNENQNYPLVNEAENRTFTRVKTSKYLYFLLISDWLGFTNLGKSSQCSVLVDAPISAEH